MILAAAAIGALSTQADRPGSMLEIALAERVCDVMVVSRTIQAADHSKCVDDQLAALRADLGAGLSRLPTSDRQKLDAACRHLAGAVTREAYLDCVSAQLAPVRERLRRANRSTAEPVVPAAEVAAPPIAPVPAPAPTPARWHAVAIAGGSIALLTAAAGAVVAIKRRQPAVHLCGTCGKPVASNGSLCADCRHQAAETLRRAAADRLAEQQNAATREKEGAEAAARQEQLQKELAAQAALAEEARRREAEEAARQREAAAQQAHAEPPEAEAMAPFDPHAILGVTADASPEMIRAAYTAACAKYDPDQVSHLSPEVQQHYREKAEAVERAFRMLS